MFDILGKKKSRCDTETLSIDRVLNKEYFYGKIMLINNPKQPLHARDSFENKIFWKITIKKELTLIFLSNPVPFNRQDYEKQKEPQNSDQSFFRLQKKSKKIPILVMYYLIKLDDVL